MQQIISVAIDVLQSPSPGSKTNLIIVLSNFPIWRNKTIQYAFFLTAVIPVNLTQSDNRLDFIKSYMHQKRVTARRILGGWPHCGINLQHKSLNLVSKVSILLPFEFYFIVYNIKTYTIEKYCFSHVKHIGKHIRKLNYINL